MIISQKAAKALLALSLAAAFLGACKNPGPGLSSKVPSASGKTSSHETAEYSSSETGSSGVSYESGVNSMQQSGGASKGQSNISSVKSGGAAPSSKPVTSSEIPASQLKPDAARLAAAKQLVSATAAANGVTDAMLNNSVVSKGNGVRIANAMRKAMRGQSIRIGVLGGSITEGFFAAAETARYANQVLKWWTTVFPGVQVTLVNAGKGSTDSVIGAHRVKEDLLDRNVDFAIVEFAVNDRATELFYQATYESTVRQLLEDPSGVGVLLLFLSRRDGVTAQAMQEPVGRHYDLPMLSYKDAFGTAPFWNSLTDDGIHPKSNGHACIGLMVNQYLTGIYESILSFGTAAPALPAQPYNARGKDYLKGRIVDPGNIMNETGFKLMDMGGFDFSTKKITIGSRTFSGVTASASQQIPPFTVELNNCRNLFILMRRSPQGVQADVQIDGQTPVRIDSYYDGDAHAWASGEVFRSAAPKTITVRVKPVVRQGGSFDILGFLVS